MDLTTFCFGPSLKIFPLLKKRNIPVILCSAKTKMEQEKIRKKLHIDDPFIVENGGGIYIPKNYFTSITKKNITIRETEKYYVLCMGREYSEIRKILCHIRKAKNIPFKGFGDLTVEQVSKITGLSLEEAYLAKKREFDETIISEEPDNLCREIEKYHLYCIHGGRFFHVLDKRASKGVCVRLLTDMFKRELNKKIISIGVGDSKNDLPLLEEVDIPILVEKKGGGWIKTKTPNIIKVEGIGPTGWARAILNILEKYPASN